MQDNEFTFGVNEKFTDVLLEFIDDEELRIKINDLRNRELNDKEIIAVKLLRIKLDMYSITKYTTLDRTTIKALCAVYLPSIYYNWLFDKYNNDKDYAKLTDLILKCKGLDVEAFEPEQKNELNR